MFKKLLVGITTTIIILFIGTIKILDYFRISNILVDIIGNVNYNNINRIDEEILTGIGGGDETYIFNIEDTTKVNCKLIDKYPESTDTLSNITKKHLNGLNMDCSKIVSGNDDRLVGVSIQNDILILNILQ